MPHSGVLGLELEVRDNTIFNGSEWSGPTSIEKQTRVCVCVCGGRGVMFGFKTCVRGEGGEDPQGLEGMALRGLTAPILPIPTVTFVFDRGSARG